jgi:predicted methyltransferase
MSNRLGVAGLAVLTLAAHLAFPALAETDAGTAAKLKAAAAAPLRSDANKARDAYRHPVETLTFFGLKDNMTVVEVWPSGGWWTEILAPVLKDKGKYVAANWDPNSKTAFFAKAAVGFKEMVAKQPAFDKVEVGVLAPDTQSYTPVPKGTADMVLTFRNIHNWMASDSQDAMFKAFYDALKPGGYLGVEEHRAKTDTPQDPKAVSGYVREDYAIALAEKAGFKLVKKSEINANPKDTKDYPKGVWTLPPNYREKDVDRDKYTAIGESDRFTMLFQKPAN